MFVFKQPSLGSSHVLALLSAVEKDRIADGLEKITNCDLSSTSALGVRGIRNNAVLASRLHLFAKFLHRYPGWVHT